MEHEVGSRKLKELEAMTYVRVVVSSSREDVRTSISAAAAEVGAEIVGHADNGVHTVDLARASHPDCILLDHDSPGLSGFEVLPILRADLPFTPVVLIAADESIGPRAIEAGAFALVQLWRLSDLVPEFERVINYIETGGDDELGDRRFIDRRAFQDWQKVTSERRAWDRRTDRPYEYSDPE
ncbi:MAG: response regulator [Actinomycetia bacterium]|nr:response regulator [Actinomycetes bacterium]